MNKYSQRGLHTAMVSYQPSFLFALLRVFAKYTSCLMLATLCGLFLTANSFAKEPATRTQQTLTEETQPEAGISQAPTETAIERTNDDKTEDSQECNTDCLRDRTSRETVSAFVSAINKEDAALAASKLDMAHIVRTALTIATDNEDDRRALAESFFNKTPHFVTQWLLAKLIGEDSPTWFIRIFNQDEYAQSPRSLLRIDYDDSGHHYLLLETNQDGSLIQDADMTATGSRLTEYWASVASSMLMPATDSSPSDTTEDGHANSENEASKDSSMANAASRGLDVQQVEAINTMLTAFFAQRFTDALKALQQMDARHHIEKWWQMTAVKIARAVDEESFKTALSELAAHHSADKRVYFALYDHFVFEKKFRTADRILDHALDRYGEDGALYNLKADVYYRQDRLSRSERMARKAIDVEYDFEDAYWTLITLKTEAGAYYQVTRNLDKLREIFNYVFTREDFAGLEFYRAFTRSRVFDVWIDRVATGQEAKSEGNKVEAL